MHDQMRKLDKKKVRTAAYNIIIIRINVETGWANPHIIFGQIGHLSLRDFFELKIIYSLI